MLKNYVYNPYKRIPSSGNFYEIDCSGNVRETIGKKPGELSFLLNTALEDTIVVDGHVVKFA